MRHLRLEEVVRLHGLLIAASGGSHGIRDQGALESAVAQPRMTFGGEDLYPTLIGEGFGPRLFPFVDGNKRVGHAAMESLLVLNGMEIQAPVDVQEEIILRLAAGQMDRESFTEWLRVHAHAMPSSGTPATRIP